MLRVKYVLSWFPSSAIVTIFFSTLNTQHSTLNTEHRVDSNTRTRRAVSRVHEVRPALRTQEFFEANERIAHAGHFLGTRLPRLSDLAAVLLEYEREVSVPNVPAAVIRRLLAPLAWFGRRRLRAR